MQIEIEQQSEDKLSRKVWKFETRYDYQGQWIVLMFYGEQSRQTKRHKWKGNFWSCVDERDYYSKLKRPKTIPDEVLDELMGKIIEAERNTPRKVAVGWSNLKSVIGTVSTANPTLQN